MSDGPAVPPDTLRRRTVPRGVTTVIVTYVAALLGAAVGAAIGGQVPCEGFLCSLGNLLIGGLLGAAASAAVVAAVAHRDGVGWWYTPIAYGIPLAALGLAWTMLGQPGEPSSAVLVILAGSAPLTAIALAAPMPRWVRAALLALVAVALVLGPIVVREADEAARADQRRRAVATWQGEGLPVYAPVGRSDVEVTTVSVRPTREGDTRQAWYQIAQAGVGGEARVWIETGPDARSQCDDARNATDQGGGVLGLGGPDPTTLCRVFDDGKASVWQDGPDGDWDSERLLALTRGLQPSDTAWLEAHLTRG